MLRLSQWGICGSPRHPQAQTHDQISANQQIEFEEPASIHAKEEMKIIIIHRINAFVCVLQALDDVKADLRTPSPVWKINSIE